MLVSALVEFPFQLNPISLLFLLYTSILLSPSFRSVEQESRLPVVLGSCGILIVAISLGFVRLSYGQQALTPLDETIHHKQLLNQHVEKEKMFAIQKLAPHNAMTWIASAQQLREFHGQAETCLVWNRALQLELPKPSTGLPEQFLAAAPTLTLCH